MSQTEDYIVHVFLISILGLALYQVLIDRIFGVTYTAAAWFASIWAFSPQPELMASASFLSKFHVFLALTFFAYFPFTKLVHLWTLPINYFVRPYQSMRTVRFWAQRKWELSLRSDKSFLVYGLSFFAIGAFILSLFLGSPTLSGLPDTTDEQRRDGSPLLGYPLYVSQCARCHGNDGAGDGPGANSPNFASLPRDLITADYRFVSTDNGIASDEDLYRTLADGLPKAGMPAFSQLSTEQIQSLVTVMKRFWKDRSEPGQTIKIAPRPVVTDEMIDVGRALYADSCAMCHGERGLGDGDAGEFIQDLQGHAVVPTNLAKGKLKAGRNPEQIYLRVAAGIPGGESGFLMPPFDFLSAEETWALVEYLETEILPPKN